MAARDVDIYIGITVQTEEIEKANARLVELSENIQKLQSISGQGIQPMTKGTEEMNRNLSEANNVVKQMSSSVSGLGPTFSGVTEGSDTLRASFIEAERASEGIRKALKILPADFDRAWTVAREIPYSDWRAFDQLATQIGKDLGYSEEGLRDFVNTARVLRAIQRIGFGVDIDIKGFDKVKDALHLTEGEVNKAINIVRKLSEEQVQVQIGVPDITSQLSNIGVGIERVGKQEAVLSQLSYAAANAHKLQGTELSSLASVLKMSESELISYGQSVEKTAKDWQMYRAYIVGMRGAVGPLGFAFRDVTMQMYWASLGFLFMTMTMGRAERASLVAKQRAFDLAKAYYNLSELQKAAAEAAIIYGSGSEEARKASVNLSMAQKQLELQQESLRVSIKSEVLAGYQMMLTTIPLTVNTIYGMITAIGALNGMLNASRQSKINDAISNTFLSSSNTQITGTTYAFAGALTGASVAEAQVPINAAIASGGLHGLTVALMGSTFAANLLIGALTMGIGLLVSIGLSSLLASKAEADTEEAMKRMTEEAKKQSSAWQGVSSSMDGVSYAAKGGSLYESIRDVIGMLDRYKGVLDEVKNSSIVYSVTGEIEVIKVPEVKDQSMSIVQSLIPIQIPQVQDQMQNIVQEVQTTTVPVIQDQTQFINQKLREIEIPEIEGQIQNIIQILKSINIPNVGNQEQVIFQILKGIEIQKVPDQIQSIYQKLSEVSIPRVQDEIQIIKQQLIEAKIPEPKIEDVIQTITQKLKEVEVKDIPSMNQIIVQELIKAKIPEVENISQNIVQNLISARIPGIRDQEQNINQILNLATIPTIEDGVQNINQILNPVIIPNIENKTQIIKQQLIESEIPIPKVESLTQTIVQKLDEVQIKNIPSITQVITQVLKEVKIPEINNISQNIIQKLQEANIKDVPSMTQLINQQLKEVNIPNIEDSTQNIYQRLVETRIPEVDDQSQIIQQILNQVPIPEIKDQTQSITQELTKARIESPDQLYQRIIQILEETKIPFPEDTIQKIVQVLKPVEIPKVEDQTQTIRQEFEINMVSLGLGINILNLTINSLDNISKKFIETTEDINKFSKALGPHSMAGSARQARQEMELLTNTMKVPEFRTPLQVNVAQLNMQQREAPTPISIYAPIQVSVTDKREIPNISNQIEEGIVRAVRTRGRLQ